MQILLKQALGEQVLGPQEIAQGVSKVAQQLNQTYQSAVIISVVPGGILFTADLVRQLEFNIEMDYISCPHTPGDNNNQSAIVYHQNIDIQGKDVILVDDALESGSTMKRLITHFLQLERARSLAVATLLVKPGRVDLAAPQYFAYELPTDAMIVGYGLPLDNQYRHLNAIFKASKES